MSTKKKSTLASTASAAAKASTSAADKAVGKTTSKSSSGGGNAFTKAYSSMASTQPAYRAESYSGSLNIPQAENTYNPTYFKSSAKASKPGSNTSYKPNKFTEKYNPGKYQSKYMPQIENMTQKLVNWQYDPLADANYQNLAKVYTANGNLAAKNSLADAASLNGGYGTSAAVTAAQQSRNQYNQQLAALVPELEQAAYAKLQGGLDALTGLDSTMYGRFSDDEARRLQAIQQHLDAFTTNEGNRQFAAQHNLNAWQAGRDDYWKANNYALDAFNTNSAIDQYAADMAYKYAGLNADNMYRNAQFGLDAWLANQGERQFAWNAESTNAQQAAANAWDYLDYMQKLEAAKAAGSGGGGGGRRGGGGGGYSGGGSDYLLSLWNDAQDGSSGSSPTSFSLPNHETNYNTYHAYKNSDDPSLKSRSNVALANLKGMSQTRYYKNPGKGDGSLPKKSTASSKPVSGWINKDPWNDKYKKYK